MHTPENTGAVAQQRGVTRAHRRRESSKFAIIRQSSIGGNRCDTIARLGKKIGDGRYFVFYDLDPAATVSHSRWINPSDIFETRDQASAALALEAAA